MKPASFFGALVFALVALAHLLRLLLRVEVVVAGAVIPMWASAVGLLVAAGLAVALWREASGSSLEHAA
jgi:hypothetical protein